MKYNFKSGAELLEKCKELNMTIHELCVEKEKQNLLEYQKKK